MVTKQTVVIAARTRKWCERLNKEIGYFYEADLEGMCCIASVELHLRLAEVGIHSSIIANTEHCFLVVNKMIVDITATQFGQTDEIYITPYLAERTGWWRRHRRFEDANSFIKWQKKVKWEESQIANPYLFRGIAKYENVKSKIHYRQKQRRGGDWFPFTPY